MGKHNNKHGGNGRQGFGKSHNGPVNSNDTADLIEALVEIAIWVYRRWSKKSKAAK